MRERIAAVHLNLTEDSFLKFIAPSFTLPASNSSIAAAIVTTAAVASAAAA